LKRNTVLIPDTFDREQYQTTFPDKALLVDAYSRFALKSKDDRFLADCYQAGGDWGFNFLVNGNITDLLHDYDDVFR
jgi:hypothetical protein